jgi:hypothetical protein
MNTETGDALLMTAVFYQCGSVVILLLSLSLYASVASLFFYYSRNLEEITIRFRGIAHRFIVRQRWERNIFTPTRADAIALLPVRLAKVSRNL